MKRIVSLILICCLAMALSVGAFAAGKTEYSGGLSLSADTVEKGQTVDLTMSFPADLLATVQFGISFDTEYLEVTAITAPGADEMDGFGLYAASDVATANANGLVTIAYVGAKGDNVLEFGDAVVTVTFKALTVGTTTISVAGEDKHPMIMENLQLDGYTPNKEYAPKADSVELTITEPAYVLGDLNGDGQVNAIDLTILFQYVNKQITTLQIPQAGDINEDGVINAIDLTILFQYVNKQIPEL